MSSVETATPGEPAAERSSSGDAAKIERAYQRMRQDIMAGVYGPNERLVEAPLTRHLAVSRNTLRTVLARLQHEGLIVLQPNRGARVRTFTLDEARDILLVREALEGLVAGLAATRATSEQRERLRTIVADTEQARDADDVRRYSTLNRQFHNSLIEAARSPKAAAFLESLNFPLVKYQFQAALVPGRKAESVAEHREILRAVEAKDAEAAERVARFHIRQVQAVTDRYGASELGMSDQQAFGVDCRGHRSGTAP